MYKTVELINEVFEVFVISYVKENKRNKMKKIILLLTFAILSMTIIDSCKKDKDKEPNPNKGVTAEKTNVKTYEIINLIAHVDLADKYNATFGSATIELIKTSDNTLTFYVPDIVEGEASLKFDLAEIKFNVTKTSEANIDLLISDLFKSFDKKVSEMSSNTPYEKEVIDSLNKFKQDVLGLFQSLPEEQKKLNGLFFEANKDIFSTFNSSYISTFNAPTIFRSAQPQSDCPKTDYKSFYMCTAKNVSWHAYVLDLRLSELSAVLKISSYWLPGITLLVTGARPEIALLRGNLLFFLPEPWILSDDIFDNVQKKFVHDKHTPLNLNGKFRSMDPSIDYFLDKGPIHFFNRINSLKNTWSLFSFLRDFPQYTENEKDAGISYFNNVDIDKSSITNSNVEFMGGVGALDPSLKFISKTGNKETFSFKIRVTMQGFVIEKLISGCTVDGPEPASIRIVSGNLQIGSANTNLSNPLIVEVKDALGIVMSGVTINWTEVLGGGTLTSAATTTNIYGQASNTWRLGANGYQKVTATLKKADGIFDVSGSPLEFYASVIADSSSIYTAACVGWWIRRDMFYNYDDSLQLFSNGTCIMYIDGTPYTHYWYIEKTGSEYRLQDGTNYGSFNIERLSWPVGTFKIYSTSPSSPKYVFTKK